MAGVQLTGMASGLDTRAIVDQLMSIEQQGRARITLRQAAAQARQDGLKELQSKLTAVKTAADALKSEGTWGTVQTATASDATKVGVRTTGVAGPGGYQVDVTRLASADQHTYAAPTGPVTLTFRNNTPGGDTSARGDVVIPAGTSLDDTVKLINAKAEAGVVAVNAGGKLVLAAKETGEAKRFTVDGLSEDPALAQQGQDASFKVGTATYTSPTNVTGSALAGLELTLKGTGTSFVTVNAPATDQEAVTKATKAFVDAYNALVDATRSKLSEKREPTATTTSAAKKGALFGDNGLTGMLGALRGSFGTEALALGVSTGAASATTSADAKAGKLSFDSASFAAALAKDPSAARTQVEAMLTKLDRQLEPYTKTGGIMDGRVAASGGDLTRIKDQLTRFDSRLETKEAGYQRQFAALESALGKSQQMQASMAASLSRLG